MENGLSKLLSPFLISDFISHYEKNEPVLVQTLEKSIEDIKTLAPLASLDSLLNSWPLSIQAHLPDKRDEVSSIDANSKDAKKLFENGMGLLFNEAQNVLPELSSWIIGIQKELGLSNLTYGRSLIYATPDGRGTAPHFDQNINFVLQLHGTKKWLMAPNHSIQNPLTRHTMGTQADPELLSYVTESFPLEMPDNTQSFELRPGSLLFVPRGYWHSTLAQGDALALNFTFTAPAWIDLFTSALRSRLIQDPLWRETADGLSDFHERDTAEMKLNFLLQSLIEDIPHWRAEDILNATEETFDDLQDGQS